MITGVQMYDETSAQCVCPRCSPAALCTRQPQGPLAAPSSAPEGRLRKSLGSELCSGCQELSGECRLGLLQVSGGQVQVWGPPPHVLYWCCFILFFKRKKILLLSSYSFLRYSPLPPSHMQSFPRPTPFFLSVDWEVCTITRPLWVSHLK